LASKKNTTPPSETLPFGAGALDASPSKDEGATARKTRRRTAKKTAEKEDGEPKAAEKKTSAEKETVTRKGAAASRSGAESPEKPRARRPRRRTKASDESETRARSDVADETPEPETEARAPRAEPRQDEPGEAASRPAAPRNPDAAEASGGEEGPVDPSATPQRRSGRAERRRRWQERRRRRRLGLPLDDLAPGAAAPSGGQGPSRSEGGGTGHGAPSRGERPAREARPAAELQEGEGMLVLEKANHGHLRSAENGFLASKNDIHVAPWQVQKFGLREGSMIRGRYRRGQGRNKWDLVDVLAVDGQDPRQMRNLPTFKNLTTIDPDFHYALGDESGEVSLKVIDLLAPIGRGQRGLIVASPRSGKTILLQQIAKAIEKIYTDVELMVLLVDERPEEATEWKRSVSNGQVFVSTNDEPAKRHVELAEVVWRRARRLVELGKDVVLLLDSITRLGRAANNVWGTSGKTMSGGIDTRALERPKQLFGSARNTENAGSLTILATALVETGSRMDQVIFEEFKGTGNMELVLSRKLADRRIFPAIDIEKTGTRKEEKLHSARRMARVNTLRRVLMRMHWAEAMELLVTKLDDVDRIDDFLQRFDVDPDAGDEGKQAVSPVRMRW
jgi:transcription termination factor Rho